MFIGQWKGKQVLPILFKDRLEGDDVELFVDFITSMLRWDPAERQTAAELLRHPWLAPNQ